MTDFLSRFSSHSYTHQYYDCFLETKHAPSSLTGCQQHFVASSALNKKLYVPTPVRSPCPDVPQLDRCMFCPTDIRVDPATDMILSSCYRVRICCSLRTGGRHLHLAEDRLDATGCAAEQCQDAAHHAAATRRWVVIYDDENTIR